MLEIKNLTVAVEGKTILDGIDLALDAGEVHAIMGPNGSGKSTLAHVLAGRDGYELLDGQVLFKGEDLLAMAPEERAGAGMFLAFQYPVEIAGVANATFLRTALNAQRKRRGEPEIDAINFLKAARAKLKALRMDEAFLTRAVNVSFSGGEKKRNEIFQMAMLEPTLAVLDETDSGLDIDTLRIVADAVNSMRGPERSMLVITHYQRLLTYIVPDRVHVLARGRIVKSGDKALAIELEEKGYGQFGAAA